MKAKNLCVYAGLCAGVASVATGQVQKTGELQQATAGQQIDPLQIAKAGIRDGKIVFQSDWIDYNGAASRGTMVQIFDCFGDADADGAPDGGDLCGLSQPGSRWFFGTGYCNMFTTNDMTVDPDTVLEDGAYRADFAWWWTASGSFTSENCIIAIFTQDSAPCDADSFDYSGWLLSYGTLAHGGYYYSNVTLSSGTWPLPTGGSGSYWIMYLQDVTTSGAWVLATCAQTMLWATPDNHGHYAGGSTQGPLQFDDDTVFDGSHTSSECYSYSYSTLCPSILGAMLQFWGNTGDECGFADCDGNGSVNTQDFLCYLGLWSSGDSAADCDGHGSINTQDFLSYLSLWSACR